MPDKKDKGTLKRRDFLKLIGVIGGSAAVSGCWSEPSDEIIPYVIPPDDVIPGIPKWYSSTCTECPAGCGIIVKNMEGRAIKLEGNPSSPVNSGSLCSRGQASLQGQYNPDRFRSPLYKSDSGKFEPMSWEDIETKISEIIKKITDNNGSKIVFLTNDITGSLQVLVNQWLTALGGGRHIIYEPVSYESQKEANKITFGLDKIPSYRIDNAEYVISIGADFLETWQSPVQYSKQFSKMHGFDNHKMGKLIYVAPRCSLTGANSDLWLKIKPGTEINFVLGLIKEIIDSNLSANPASTMIRSMVASYDLETVSRATEIEAETIRGIAREFTASKASLALGGSINTATSNSTKLLVAINLLNYIGGNIDKTINFNSSLSITNASSYEDMELLVDSMTEGNVDLLITYNTNPVYSLPKAIGFVSALKNVSNVISFSSYPDETTALSHYILPDSTNLEKWGDFFPQEGVYGLIQPAMKQIFNTKPIGDVLLSIAKKAGANDPKLAFAEFYDYLRNQWVKIHESNESIKSFETFWKDSLQIGGYYDIKAPSFISLSTEVMNFSFGGSEFININNDFYLIPHPSIKLYDGRGANRPWLQELPDPLTTAVWDSWVEINPESAKNLGIEEGDYIDVEIQDEKITVQAYLYPGIRKDSLAISLGQGHSNIGRYGDNRGVNISSILPRAKDDLSGGFSWLFTKVKISKSNKREKLVKTQYTFSQLDRKIAQSVSINEALGGHNGDHKANGHIKHAGGGKEENGHHGNLTMYPPLDYFSYKWGMSIDLSKCVGCGSCVTACNAENNVSFVGKDQVSRGRYMGWIRIERFFEHDEHGKLKTRFIPMLCQHCDNAPCEPVCPVYATYHNYEGLNVMVYNRCVGTRYCSNNCTYKVRRFNWYDYELPEPFNLQLNPDVTVREKGVMEKCTFCSQRIIAAKDKAKDENRKVRDGEVKPACAQTCPSEAITFGDIKDHESEVYKKSHDSRSYAVLEEINTLPSIKYLKKVEWDKA